MFFSASQPSFCQCPFILVPSGFNYISNYPAREAVVLVQSLSDTSLSVIARSEIPRLRFGTSSAIPPPCLCEADFSQPKQSLRLPSSRLPARRMTPAGEPSLGLLALKLPPAIAVRRAGQRRQAGKSLAMTVKFEIKLSENPKTRGKPLTRRGDVIYSICQLNGQ